MEVKHVNVSLLVGGCSIFNIVSKTSCCLKHYVQTKIAVNKHMYSSPKYKYLVLKYKY